MSLSVSQNFAVPDDLAERDQWILWRRESSGHRETKVPYSVQGHRASSTDRSHWSGLDQALDTWRRYPRRYAGLGFVFTSEDPFVGIDLDDCLEAGGVLKDWAVEGRAQAWHKGNPSDSLRRMVGSASKSIPAHGEPLRDLG